VNAAADEAFRSGKAEPLNPFGAAGKN